MGERRGAEGESGNFEIEDKAAPLGSIVLYEFKELLYNKLHLPLALSTFSEFIIPSIFDHDSITSPLFHTHTFIEHPFNT